MSEGTAKQADSPGQPHPGKSAVDQATILLSPSDDQTVKRRSVANTSVPTALIEGVG